MQSPYTPDPFQAYQIAHQAASLLVAGTVASRRRTLGLAAVPYLSATVVLGALPTLHAALAPLRYPALAAGFWETGLSLATAALVLGALMSGARAAIGGALAGVVVIGARSYFTESNWELCTLCLMAVAWSAGYSVVGRGAAVPATARPERRWATEAIVVGLGFVLCVATCAWVMRFGTDSSDEWSYTFQAAIFAKLRISGSAAPCGEAFRNFWVFDWQGQRFSMYTPGWPMFMAPFLALGVPWLAGPVALATLILGVMRLAGRLGTRPQEASIAAGLAVGLGATYLINGASRFPHVFVATTTAWALEWTLCSQETSGRAARAYAALAGASLAACAATRPSDGLFLATGALYLTVVGLATRRISLAQLGYGILGAAAIGVPTLLILKSQVGSWFQTGYSLNPHFHPWNKIEISTPKPSDWRWAIPLATGVYCWWPASPVLASLGFGALKSQPHLRNAILLPLIPYLAFYCYLSVGRFPDFGYGPRYELPVVVALAVGTGAFVASFGAQAPNALRAFVLVSVLACVRLFPLLFPTTYDQIAQQQALKYEAGRAGIHHAVVLMRPGIGPRGPWDYTQNLPLDLYPGQDVIFAHAPTAGDEQCLRGAFPSRAFAEATGNPPHVTPLP